MPVLRAVHNKPCPHRCIGVAQVAGVAPQRHKDIRHTFLHIPFPPGQNAAQDTAHQRGVVPHGPAQPCFRVLQNGLCDAGGTGVFHCLHSFSFWRLHSGRQRRTGFSYTHASTKNPPAKPGDLIAVYFLSPSLSISSCKNWETGRCTLRRRRFRGCGGGGGAVR